MGIRIPYPGRESGNDCYYCSPPVGSLFPSGSTPDKVYVLFHGIIPCPGYSGNCPNAIPFILHQDSIESCKYTHNGSVWTVEFYYRFPTVSNSLVYCTKNGVGTFFDALDVVCPFEFYGIENDLRHCLYGNKGYSGFAVVSWSDIPRELIDDLGFASPGSSFYDSMPVDQDSSVLRLASTIDHTCVKVKLVL